MKVKWQPYPLVALGAHCEPSKDIKKTSRKETKGIGFEENEEDEGKSDEMMSWMMEVEGKSSSDVFSRR
jgi:hypothetical protein